MDVQWKCPDDTILDLRVTFLVAWHHDPFDQYLVAWVWYRPEPFKRQFRTAQANWGGRGAAGAEFEGARIEALKGVWGCCARSPEKCLILALNMMSFGAFWVVFFTVQLSVCQLATTHFTD